MIKWEGAELCYYYNGESHSLDLSNTQFAVVAKILGLELTAEEISYFSDDTLKSFAEMKGNPLKLKKAK